MKAVKFLLLFVVFFFLMSAHFSFAQGAETEESKSEICKIDEMVVTATRTEKKVDDAPAKVTVITKEEIERYHIKTIDDALRHEVGVYIKRSNPISESTAKVIMRGFSGQDQVLVLLDGVPVNEGYFGGVNWDTINIKSVERIEVTRGGGSALYGGNAMGGVINIVTSKPKKLEAEIYGGYGSDATYKYGALAGNRYDRFSIRFGYEAEETDGYPTKLVSRSISSGSGTLTGGYEMVDANGSSKWVCGNTGDKNAERSNANFMFAYDVTETGTLTFNFQRGTSDYEYDRPTTYLTDASGASVFEGTIDVPGSRKASVKPYNFLSGSGGIENHAGSLVYTETFGGVDFKGKLGYQDDDKWYTSPSSGTYDDAPGKGTYYGTETWTADLQADFPLGENHLLTTGGYFKSDDFDLDSYTLSYYRDEDTKLDKTGITQGKDRLYAVYLQDEWRILDRLTLYGGVRFDFWEVYDGNSGNIGSEEAAEDSDDSAISPQIAGVWNPLPDTYVRCSVGKAFRAPNIYELFRTWTSSMGITYHGNSSLKPETTWTYDAGVSQYLFDRKMKLSAGFFYTRAKDLIGQKKESSTEYYYKNIGEADIRGWELEASVTPLEWLALWANYTDTYSEVKKNKSDPTTEGKYLADYPLNTFNAGCDLTYKQFKARLTGNYLGRIYTSEQNDDVADTYMGYSKGWLWDAKITYTPVQYVECAFSVDNIFDEEYFSYSPGRGRSCFFEVSLKY